MAENQLTVPVNPARALRELNRQEAAAPPLLPTDDSNPEKQNNNTILQSDKPTDKPTNKQPNRQSDKPTDKLTNLETDPPTNNLTDSQTDQPTNNHTNKRTKKPTPKNAEPKHAEADPQREIDPPRPQRVDGRTMRPRQDTADRTMVTSMRLAVSTLEALDEHCYRYRQRKQDVVQAALDLYFASIEAETD